MGCDIEDEPSTKIFCRGITSHVGYTIAMKKPFSEQSYTVYVVQCADGTLYTGITTDIDRRMREHNGIEPGGAKYTQARRPVVLVYTVGMSDRASASQEEHRIKKLSRQAKLRLVQS